MSTSDQSTGGNNNNPEGVDQHQQQLRSPAAAAATARNDQQPQQAQQQQQQQPLLPPPRIPFNISLNHQQASLRQRAHSPVAGVGVAAAVAPAPVIRGRSPFANNSNRNSYRSLEDAGTASASAAAEYGNTNNVNFGNNNPLMMEQQDNNNNPAPEAHNNNEEANIDNENRVSTVSGWSDVDLTAGGLPPSPRSLHSAALLNGVMYVFGGYDGSQRVNSFHAYSFAEKRWSPVLPSAASGPPPSPRDRHASVAWANSFYVHGGFDGTARDASLFCFDFSTMAWREVASTSGRPPSARHSHAAVVYNRSMYIFGGYDGSYKSDLHEFDFVTSRWSAVPAAGRRPRARYRATCTVFKNQMILFGGHDGTRHLADTFVFDFDSKSWHSLITEGPPPIPRDSHVSVTHGDSMYVFGGSSGSAMNDLHELQLPTSTPTTTSASASAGTATTPAITTARWRPVSNASRADQPRHRFCHVAVCYNDSMYVFGGYDGAERLNSFIKFDFAVYDLSFEIPPSTIISDFASLVNNDTLSDVTFIVEGREVHAHKLMLMRCSYFEALFLGQMREASMDTIHIEQVRHDIFLMILEYLYTDQLTISFNNAMELFEAADLFCIHRLKTMCEKRMLQCITVENAAGIFHAADMHSATALRQKAKKYILSHFEDVSKSSAFEEMGRLNIELVFELLQSR